MKQSFFNSKDLRIYIDDQEFICATYLIKCDDVYLHTEYWQVIQFKYDYDNKLIYMENYIIINKNLELQALYHNVEDKDKVKYLLKQFKDNLIFK